MPSYSGTASSSASGAVCRTGTTISGGKDTTPSGGSIPEPAAPPRPRIISTALRSTASRTLTALTLTAQWSLSHGRMFHSYFSPVCLPEGVAVRIIAGPRSNSTAFAPHVTIWNDQILTVLVFPNPLFVFQMRPIQTFALALYRCCIAWPFLNVSITHGKWLEQ